MEVNEVSSGDFAWLAMRLKLWVAKWLHVAVDSILGWL